jgi:hypothetical protein
MRACGSFGSIVATGHGDESQVMSTSLTVRDLFVGATGGVNEDDATVHMPPVPETLSALVTGFEWQGLGNRVLDLLGQPVIDVMLAAWVTHDEVVTRLHETTVDPSATVLVHLASHTLESTHRPSLELWVEQRRVLELSFLVALTFDIDVVELTVRSGAVCAIRIRAVNARGTVRLGQAVILERRMSPLMLPPRITLREEPPMPHHASSESADEDTTELLPERLTTPSTTPASAGATPYWGVTAPVSWTWSLLSRAPKNQSRARRQISSPA